jgi:tRNA modification GTPase
VDTIVAIATAPGQGGIGVVRLSGPLAYSIAIQLTQTKLIKPRQALYRSIYNQNHELLDTGLILYFKAPFSFTGEDVVELQVHGSPMILNLIVKACVTLGARLARPGEFSERAFLNDKIDLTQAEAIADLIAASSETSARLAVRSLQGDFSEKIQGLNQQIIALRLYVEAAIDFPEEEIDFLNDGKIASMLQAILDFLEDIKKNAGQGALLRDGATVVIAGQPNVGKSTLMNALAGYDVAIVTDIAGTTRDVMRESILLDDFPIQMIDTAGLRDTEDFVEQEGIRRAWQAVERADCLLLVRDITDADQDFFLSEAIKNKLPKHVPLIHVVNKIDKLSQNSYCNENTVYLSAHQKDGLSFLKDMIKARVGFQPTEGIFLARQRHVDALKLAYDYLVAGQKQLLIHQAGELLAEDLKQAHLALCTITGEFTSDDLLGEIFSSFCIGK